MTAPDSVFILKPILDDPRFRGFGIGDHATSVLGHEQAYDDLLVDNGESLNWQPRSLAKRWKPMPVTGPVNPFNDYPCLELAEPVFSRRAVDVLGEMLTKNGELLPVKTTVGEYFLYIVLTKLNALDLTKSKMVRTSPRKTALDIDYFAFNRAALRGTAIFRVREHPNIYLVTDAFKARVEQAGLNGFHFIKVWPLPRGASYRRDEIARRRKSKSAKLVGEAVIIRCRLSRPIPSAREKKRADSLKAAVQRKLHVGSVVEPYHGSIEAAEFTDGEFRVFCSCPSAEQLAEILMRTIERAEWAGEITVTTRLGNLFDKKAKEKRVTVRTPA